MILSLEKNKRDLQSTYRLDQERYETVQICCSGETCLFLTLPTRSGDEWHVGPKEKQPRLKASVGGEPNRPPETGWKFLDKDYKEDPSLTCSDVSAPCCLTVSLSSPAKEAQGKCEGEYQSTGLMINGKQVAAVIFTSHFVFFPGFQAGGFFQLLPVCR